MMSHKSEDNLVTCDACGSECASGEAMVCMDCFNEAEDHLENSERKAEELEQNFVGLKRDYEHLVLSVQMTMDGSSEDDPVSLCATKYQKALDTISKLRRAILYFGATRLDDYVDDALFDDMDIEKTKKLRDQALEMFERAEKRESQNDNSPRSNREQSEDR